MAVFTVLLPEGAAGDRAASRATFLREGFAWGAFWFGPVWCIVRRAWLALLLYAIAMVGVAVVAALGHLGALTTVLLAVIVHIVLGLEGNHLRRAALVRRGYRFADVLAGSGRDHAERVFFTRLAGEAPGPHPAGLVRAPAGAAIGMFEDEP